MFSTYIPHAISSYSYIPHAIGSYDPRTLVNGVNTEMTAASLAFLISGAVFAGFLLKKVHKQLSQNAKGNEEEPVESCGPYGATRSFSGVLTNND